MLNEQIKGNALEHQCAQQEMCSAGTESYVLGVYDRVAGAEAVESTGRAR